jgi:hypothetical protein
MANRAATSNSRQHSDSNSVWGIAGAIYFQNGAEAESIIFAPNQPIAPNSPDSRATGHHSLIDFGSCTTPPSLRRILEHSDNFFQAPNMIANSCFHSWRHPQGLVNPAEIVVHVMKGYRVLKILQLFAESIAQFVHVRIMLERSSICKHYFSKK